MTQDEIIDMAMLAGFESDDAYVQRQELKAFAKLIAEAEREECAKVCDEYADDPVYCGNAIRARGQE
jgi:hypothetical protein